MQGENVQPKERVFQVEGITCLDCAAKFQREIAALPGVTKAELNVMTGKLTVGGEVELETIRSIGAKENYTILSGMRSVHRPSSAPDVRRALFSGVALVLAVILEKWAAGAYVSLYAAAALIGGWSNFSKGAEALKRFKFNMSVLMSAAMAGAFIIGQYAEGATVGFLYAVSEILEKWSLFKSRHLLEQLIDAAPNTAWVKRGSKHIEVDVEDIRVGDIIMVRPGEKIPMDGVVLEGQSSVNQAVVTGESVPVFKQPGSEVFAGSINVHGALEVQVTKVVGDSTIARIVHMVEEAHAQKPRTQAFIEKFAAVYTPAVIALAAAIMIVPPLMWGYAWIDWVYRGLALLVAACPCALIISTPVAIFSAIANLARQGVLVKGGVYLEELAAVKAVAFDKTGTLTLARHEVTDIKTFGPFGESEILRLAAALESRSEHPLAKAILEAAHNLGSTVGAAADFTAIAGKGAKGVVDGRTVYIGSLRLFSELVDVPGAVKAAVERLSSQGKTVMLLGSSKEIYGLIAVADTVRAESFAAVDDLKRAGVEHVIMLTGDNEVVASSVARQLGVEYRAQLLPSDKMNEIEGLLAKYGRVAMVGDGINDAPALARATIGIAMGEAGTDAAFETADVVLMSGGLRQLPAAVAISRRALAVIKQNIGFSLVIKLLAVSSVFPGWLTLWLAVMADMGATVLVTLNSLRLYKYRPAAASFFTQL